MHSYRNAYINKLRFACLEMLGAVEAAAAATAWAVSQKNTEQGTGKVEQRNSKIVKF